MMNRLLRLLMTLCLVSLPPGAPANAADMAVIVNRSVPGGTISRASLVRVYLHGGAYWPDGSQAVSVEVEGDAEGKAIFYRESLNRSLNDVRMERARLVFTGVAVLPEAVSSYREMIRRVANVPGAVGYVPAVLVDDSVKRVEVTP